MWNKIGWKICRKFTCRFFSHKKLQQIFVDSFSKINPQRILTDYCFIKNRNKCLRICFRNKIKLVNFYQCLLPMWGCNIWEPLVGFNDCIPSNTSSSLALQRHGPMLARELRANCPHKIFLFLHVFDTKIFCPSYN